jgi:hypothetical protein
MVERLQRQIKDALCEPGAGPTWHYHLPWVLMGLLAAPKEDSVVPSAEQVNNSPLIISGQLLQMSHPPCVYVPPLPMRPASYAAVANTSLAHLAEVGHVYTQIGGHQKPLVAPYAGPYLVVSKGAKAFTIQVGQRQEIISMDHLKAHTGARYLL